MSPQTVEKRVPIMKVDEEEQVVTGPVLIPDEEDRHGDVVKEENIQDVAWTFMEEYQNVDIMHTFKDVGVPVGSMPLPGPMEIENQEGEQETIPKGAWVVQVRVVKDEVWEQVKNGDLTGFSIYGKGEREPLEEQA